MGHIGSKRKALSQEGEDVNFDHFQVLRAIGKGSFGKVCIVQKLSSERLYAMKYMNKAQCEAKDAVANVFREIEILASVEHPFLVNLWFTFQDEEDMFMVVDLLLGGDLRYHVQQGVPFSNEAVRQFILEAGSALDYLHKRNIIHRDIKPDNLLLDEAGHVHLTDFNIATVLKPGHLATSMSGTKPYMAPEVFECAADYCDGYNHAVDWWSLGVTAYEIRRGMRPFDIHSHTTISDVRLLFLSSTKFPSDWSLGFVQLLTKLLTVSPASRVTSLEALMRIPFAAEIDIEEVIKKKVKPSFTPATDHLNCDPTFELEEMIIESKPLHKKKKRLLKQKSVRDSQHAISITQHSGSIGYDSMIIFNREREETRKARERKEREWQEELDRSMNLSDPTGHGSGFCGSSKISFRRKRSTKDADAMEGVLSTLIAASAKSFAASIGPIHGCEELDHTIKSAKAQSSRFISSKTSASKSKTIPHAKSPGRIPTEERVIDASSEVVSNNVNKSTVVQNVSDVRIKVYDDRNVLKDEGEEPNILSLISDLQNQSIHEPSEETLLPKTDNKVKVLTTQILSKNCVDKEIGKKLADNSSPAEEKTISFQIKSDADSNPNLKGSSSCDAISEETAVAKFDNEESGVGEKTISVQQETASSAVENIFERKIKDTLVSTTFTVSSRPASEPLPSASASTNLVLNLTSKSLHHPSSKVLPLTTKNVSKLRKVAPVSKRSQSFVENPGERHERFIPQRNSYDTCIMQSLDDHDKTELLKKIEPLLTSQGENVTKLGKEQAEFVCVNLCSLTPRYTSSLEYLSTSSSGNLPKISNRNKSILEESKRSASEETHLLGASVPERETQLTELTCRGNEAKEKTQKECPVEKLAKCASKKSQNIHSNKQDYCKTFSSHSLQLASNTDSRKSYNRSISNDNPTTLATFLTEFETSSKSNIQKKHNNKCPPKEVANIRVTPDKDPANGKWIADRQEAFSSTDELKLHENLHNIT